MQSERERDTQTSKDFFHVFFPNELTDTYLFLTFPSHVFDYDKSLYELAFVQNIYILPNSRIPFPKILLSLLYH